MHAIKKCIYLIIITAAFPWNDFVDTQFRNTRHFFFCFILYISVTGYVTTSIEVSHFNFKGEVDAS